jgi:RNA polymerase sigma-70 factor (ECF subfamily)
VLADFDAVLGRAKRGEADSFRALYDDLARTVAGYLRSRGGQDVEDLTSEVFLGVFVGLPGFTGGQADFRSWVFTIAHRKLVDQWRQVGRRPVQVALDVELDGRHVSSAEQQALASLGDERLQKALGELSEDQRDVLLLRIVADLSIEQTAAVLDRSQGAVKQLQRRGLLALRRALQDPE